MAKDVKKNSKDVKNKKHFFKDFKAELKKVIWPTPKQLVNKTIAVIVIVLITGAIVVVLDLAFRFLNDKGIDSLKQKIKDNVAIENTVDSGEEISEDIVDVNEVEENENSEVANENNA